MILKDKLNLLLKDISPSSFSSKLKKHQDIYIELLSKNVDIKFSSLNERIYFELNDLTNIPICLSCNKLVSFISFSKGYRLYCSSDCSKSSKISSEKRKSSIKEKYGVDNIMQLENIKYKIKETNLQKYGVENPNQNNIIKEKKKKTVENKYGENNVSKVILFKEKRENTMIDKFGAKTNLISNQNEYKELLIKKYNVDNVFKSPSIRYKIKETNKKKYGVEYFSQSLFFKEKQYEKILDKLDIYLKYFNLKRNFLNKEYNGSYFIKNNKKEVIKYSFHCLSCNTDFLSGLSDGRYPNCCPVCNKKSGISSYELNLEDFLKENNITYIKNDRKIINPLEVDFYFPENNLAIEINGLYYHSFEHLNKKSISDVEIYLNESLSPDKGKNFHLLKSKLCEKKGIFLFHINENEFILKNELIKSMILNKLHLNRRKEHARNLEVRIVNNKNKREFLNENHIQGDTESFIDYGLYKGEELLSLMTFSKARYEKNEKKYSYELIRFCNKRGVSIRGAASKLLKKFLVNMEKYIIEQENKDTELEIVSFADRRYSNGNLYRELNFKEEYIIGPQQKYFKGINVYNRMFFQKKNIKAMYEDFKENKINKINFGLIKNYEEKLTAQENMYLNGFNSIYDCGLIKFKLSKKITI